VGTLAAPRRALTEAGRPPFSIMTHGTHAQHLRCAPADLLAEKEGVQKRCRGLFAGYFTNGRESAITTFWRRSLPSWPRPRQGEGISDSDEFEEVRLLAATALRQRFTGCDDLVNATRCFPDAQTEIMLAATRKAVVSNASRRCRRIPRKRGRCWHSDHKFAVTVAGGSIGASAPASCCVHRCESTSMSASRPMECRCAGIVVRRISV